jgi:hypothetical protein
MKTIENKIVFSNDINLILNGKNAINFNYIKNGIIVPTSSYIEDLRKDFKKTVNKIFSNKIEIISEENMLESIYYSIKPFYKRYPHCIFR